MPSSSTSLPNRNGAAAGSQNFSMEQIIAWARAERLDRLVLHASDEGRVLYAKMGFIQTNEMRFKDRLDIPEVGARLLGRLSFLTSKTTPSIAQ